MDDIPKTVTWILGGSSLPAAVLTLVGVAPRLIAAHPFAMAVSIFLIIAGLGCATIAGIAYLAGDQRRESRLRRQVPLVFVGLGLVATIAATAVLAVSYENTLDIKDRPRLALTITPTSPELATVKVKFDADAQQPGGFDVVDVIAVGRNTRLPVGECHSGPTPVHGLICPTAAGHRVYQAAVGSDSNGQIDSEFQTELSRSDYRLVVVETYPGPFPPDSAPGDSEAPTTLCADVQLRVPRACAYVEVPR
jgi:hypothetical protein